jgi:PAS domain S-box-containing protein
VNPSDPATERFFEAAFNAAPSGIYVFDDKGRYLYANEAAAKLMGVSVEEILKRTLGDFTPARHQPVVSRIWEALRKGDSVEGITRLRNEDGIERAVKYHATASFLPGRNLLMAQELAKGNQRLSPRESEVIQLLARGYNGTRIAEELLISRETVRTHIRNAMEKLQARTRPHAIALAVARGEIDPYNRRV